ncbi:MAG TPA: sugar kinase [Elusimicrobia bacterium]|nr:sugar kinase [Elusimicrobiota bacterium]HBT60163.1 sugar kinase [Elusimicrobiota bacterium]
MDSIVVVGSVALDSVRTLWGESKEALGGSAVYFSLAARHFARVSVVGVIGKDFPKEHRHMLAEKGIDLGGLKELPGKTFRWVGKFGKDLSDAKTLATHLNVFAKFRPRLTSAQKKSRVVFLANIDPDLQSQVLNQMSGPALVACDTMNYWITSKPEALRRLLSRVNIFFVNEEEAKILSRQPTALAAARVISHWGPKVVVVKKGEHGALMKVDNQFYAFPAYPVESVKDPTGAGDTFAGGFMGYLTAAGDYGDVVHLKRAMLYGTALASFNVEDFSTRRLENLRRSCLEDRFAEFCDALQVPHNGSAIKPRVLFSR